MVCQICMRKRTNANRAKWKNHCYFSVMKMHSELRACLFGYQFVSYFTKINFSLLHIYSDAGFMEIAQKTRTYLVCISTQMHHKAPHIMWFYTVMGWGDPEPKILLEINFIIYPHYNTFISNHTPKQIRNLLHWAAKREVDSNRGFHHFKTLRSTRGC